MYSYIPSINKRFFGIEKASKKIKIMNKAKVIKEKKHAMNYESIKGTPFTYVTDGKNHYIMVGNTSMSKEPYESKEEAYEAVKNLTWENVTNLICIIANKIANYEKENK